MKTRTKVLIAMSCATLVGGLLLAGSSDAHRHGHGGPGNESGSMAFQGSRGPRASGGPHGHHGGPQRSEQLLEDFDRNNDGKLTQAEVDQVRRDRFVQFDTDKDGKLTLQEYQALWLDAMRRHLVDGFQALDDDGNAAVIPEEFIAPFGKLVPRLDTNNDGELTRDEVRRR